MFFTTTQKMLSPYKEQIIWIINKISSDEYDNHIDNNSICDKFNLAKSKLNIEIKWIFKILNIKCVSKAITNSIDINNCKDSDLFNSVSKCINNACRDICVISKYNDDPTRTDLFTIGHYNSNLDEVYNFPMNELYYKDNTTDISTILKFKYPSYFGNGDFDLYINDDSNTTQKLNFDFSNIVKSSLISGKVLTVKIN